MKGPILLQKTVEIGPDETLGDVYFKKLFPIGVDAMIEAMDLVRAGKAPKVAAGPLQEDLRELVQEGRGRDRLVQARGRGLQPDPRRQPGARRLGHASRASKVDIFDSAKVPAAASPARSSRSTTRA